MDSIISFAIGFVGFAVGIIYGVYLTR